MSGLVGLTLALLLARNTVCPDMRLLQQSGRTLLHTDHKANGSHALQRETAEPKGNDFVPPSLDKVCFPSILLASTKNLNNKTVSLLPSTLLSADKKQTFLHHLVETPLRFNTSI